MIELAVAVQVWNADAVTAVNCSSAGGRSLILAQQPPSLREGMENQARALADAGTVPDGAAYLDGEIARICRTAGHDIDVLIPELGSVFDFRESDDFTMHFGSASCRTGLRGGEDSFCRISQVGMGASATSQICSWQVQGAFTEPGAGYRITPVWQDAGGGTYDPFTALRFEMHAEGNHSVQRRVSISGLSVRYVSRRFTPDERRAMGCQVPERAPPPPPLTTAYVNAMNRRTSPPLPPSRSQSAPSVVRGTVNPSDSRRYTLTISNPGTVRNRTAYQVTYYDSFMRRDLYLTGTIQLEPGVTWSETWLKTDATNWRVEYRHLE